MKAAGFSKTVVQYTPNKYMV